MAQYDHTCSGRSMGLKKFVIGMGVIAVLMLHSADSLRANQTSAAISQRSAKCYVSV